MEDFEKTVRPLLETLLNSAGALVPLPVPNETFINTIMREHQLAIGKAVAEFAADLKAVSHYMGNGSRLVVTHTDIDETLAALQQEATGQGGDSNGK